MNALRSRIYMSVQPSTLPGVKLAMAFNDGGNQGEPKRTLLLALG